MRFLSNINPDEIDSLDTLNMLYFKWLEEDYQKKAHTALNGLSPHDVLMSQTDNIKLVSDRRLLDEIFLYRVSRKIAPDATTQIDKILYETDMCFSGKRMEVRYDPEWLGDETKPLALFHEGKKVGELKMVRFHDNSHAKRRYPGNRKGKVKMPPDEQPVQSNISFSELMGVDSNV